MAKGTLHLNVEFSAVADEEGKFGRLAKLLGLADADHARGRCEHLWVACTRRGESELPQWLVEQVLGELGPDALVQAELAAWAGGRGDSTTRRMRIGGAAKHCLWMFPPGPNSEQSSKGGKTRASTSSRSAGRFVANHQPITSPSEISSASEILPEKISPSARAILPTAVPEPAPPRSDPPIVPAVSPPTPAHEGTATTIPPVVHRDPKPANVIPAEVARGESIAGPYNHDDPRARGRLAEATYRRVSDALVAIAVELRLPAPLPFPAITPGSHPQSLRDLQDRVREEGAAAPVVCDRVVANLIAQAREERRVEWLAEKTFGSKPWAEARQWTPGAAARRRRPQNGDLPPPAPAPKRERSAPAIMIPADVQEENRRAACEALAMLSGGPRAPPKSAAGESDTADTTDEQPTLPIDKGNAR
jgi:hypothetical protein